MSDTIPNDANPYQPPGGRQPIEAELVAPPASPPDVAHKPRVWPVFVSFLLCIVLDIVVVAVIFVSLAVLQNAGAGFNGFDLNAALDVMVESTTGFWLIMVCTSLVLAVVATTGALLSPVPFRERLNLHRPQITWVGMLVAICGTLAVSTVFVAIDGLGLLPQSETLEEIAQFVEESTPVGFLFSVLLIGLAPGFDEELMFRGYMQTRLVQRWGAGVGILITSILFGVLHMDLIQGTFAAAMGMFLGYLALQSRSIIPAMVCHAANNTISTVATYVGADGLSADAADAPVESDTVAFNLILLAASATVLGLAVWYFSRNNRRFAKRAKVAGECVESFDTTTR